MALNFRKGKEKDLDEVAALFQRAILHMTRQGIPQWDEVYPDREILRQDIEKRQLYVGVWDDRIVSVYAHVRAFGLSDRRSCRLAQGAVLSYGKAPGLNENARNGNSSSPKILIE